MKEITVTEGGGRNKHSLLMMLSHLLTSSFTSLANVRACLTLFSQKPFRKAVPQATRQEKTGVQVDFVLSAK